MTDISKAARTLAANLQTNGVTIKHVQALDLLAAGAGLANRHVLATLPALPAIRQVNVALLTSAATVLARHDLTRRQTIIDATAAILKPEANATADLITLKEYRLAIYPHELDCPYDFLATERGAAFIKHLTSDLYYSRYETYQSLRPMSLKEGNELAAAILDAKRDLRADWSEQERAMAAVAEFFTHGESTDNYWWHYARDEVSGTLDAIADELEGKGFELDPDTWLEELEGPILTRLDDEDDSEPTDLLSHADYCEVIFLLKREGYPIDEMVSSNRAWADFEDLHVGPELQHPLSALGYSIADYRMLSGNRNPGQDLRRGLKKRSEPLVTPKELKEIVENACSQYFLFALYAVVPVRQLINLDLTQPITFSQAAIATYNPFSGTFMDVIRKEPVTVSPKDGELQTGQMGVSPDDICGLHLPAYFASLKNEPKQHSPANLPLAA